LIASWRTTAGGVAIQSKSRKAFYMLSFLLDGHVGAEKRLLAMTLSILFIIAI